MDITAFVTSQRDAALLLGDYDTYRTQLSRRLLNCNKKLGRVTHKNAKYSAKKPVTAEDIGGNNECVLKTFGDVERGV
jgi:signal recognition particle subunit SRP68